jgi:hypothetical protein
MVSASNLKSDLLPLIFIIVFVRVRNLVSLLEEKYRLGVSEDWMVKIFELK